jgi:translation initiation factor 1 (eIF-1/SUI1)
LDSLARLNLNFAFFLRADPQTTMRHAASFMLVSLQLSNALHGNSFLPDTLNFVFPWTPVNHYKSHRTANSACHRCKGFCMEARGEDLISSQDLSLRLAQSLNSWKGERFFDSSTKKDNAGSVQSQVTKKASVSEKCPKTKIDVFSSKIRLQSTRAGKGGKTVTVLKGLEHLPKEDAQSILRSIKQKISVGGKIDENGVLEIQGDQVSFLLEYFSGAGYKDVKRG